MSSKTTRQLQRSFPSTMKTIQNTDLALKRQQLKQELAPLGRAHSTAEALLQQLDSVIQSGRALQGTEDDPSGAKTLKALTGALKDVASTMALLRQEVREHVGAAMSSTDANPQRDDESKPNHD